MFASNFAGRLRELRESAGLTQGQLAEQVGTTVRTISRLETGTQEPTWPTVLKLSDVLGVSCEAFKEEPSDSQPKGRGRPPKAVPSTQPADQLETGPKKPRGQLRKGK
jgi:transcriptional regulator with XRE-family HTH domain